MKKIEKRLPLTLNIQHFAEPADPVDPVDPVDPPPADVTLSQAELDKKIEAEADRKLAKALEKKQAEWNEKLEERLKEERKSAEEYAKMTAKEKEDAEYQKRVEKLEAREKEINNRELLSQIESDLKENDLPTTFAQSLLSIGDNEKIKESITGIKKDFDAAVAEKVKEALRQETPATGGGISPAKVGGQSIAEMARAARIIKN